MYVDVTFTREPICIIFHSQSNLTVYLSLPQSLLSLDVCPSLASSLMALSSTGYHQENPMEDHGTRLSMGQMVPTSLQWTLRVETPTTT